MSCGRFYIACLAVMELAPLASHAAAFEFGGHVKYQYTYTDYRADDVSAVFGDDPARDQSGELRLKTDGREGAWDFSVHYELLAIVGESVETERILAGVRTAPIYGNLLPNDDRRLWDLTHILADDGRRVAEHRLDRFSVGYRSSRTIIRFGRQAVSWGNGLAFQVFDFANPFSPVAIDKDYKTGDDMLYAQSAFTDATDVQAMIVPRRDPVSGDLQNDQSSYAAKLRTRIGDWDIDALIARHYDEGIAGVGFARNVGGAVWRLDASYTSLKDGGSAVSAVTNLDYSWTWAGKNVYGYVEYFRSGVGEASADDYRSPDPELVARLQRGELFTLARDYVGLGLQVELTPLFNLFNNLIINGNDGSLFYQLRGVYDWRQNMQFMAGANLAFGERGDEFGGVPTSLPGVYVSPGRSVFARLAWYF